MNKKIKKGIIILISLVIFYFISLSIQTSKIESNFFTSPQGIIQILENYELIRCDYNIFKPELAIVVFTNEEFGGIEFFKFDKTFMSDEDIKKIKPYFWISHIPVTTFKELLKKIKDDCYYFEKDDYELTKEDLKKFRDMYVKVGGNEEGLNQIIYEFRQQKYRRSEGEIERKERKDKELEEIMKNMKTFKPTEDNLAKMRKLLIENGLTNEKELKESMDGYIREGVIQTNMNLDEIEI